MIKIGGYCIEKRAGNSWKQWKITIILHSW